MIDFVAVACHFKPIQSNECIRDGKTKNTGSEEGKNAALTETGAARVELFLVGP